MTVEVVTEAPGWQAIGLPALAERAAGATLRRLGLDPAAFDVALLACDDARIAALNDRFRDRPRPTNVLSWPAADLSPQRAGGAPAPPDPGDLGDIALALETCRREAQSAGTPLEDHLTHLIVHGLLHLLGYDHETEQDAAMMEGLETEILASLGVADPY